MIHNIIDGTVPSLLMERSMTANVKKKKMKHWPGEENKILAFLLLPAFFVFVISESTLVGLDVRFKCEHIQDSTWKKKGLNFSGKKNYRYLVLLPTDRGKLLSLSHPSFPRRAIFAFFVPPNLPKADH